MAHVCVFSLHRIPPGALLGPGQVRVAAPSRKSVVSDAAYDALGPDDDGANLLIRVFASLRAEEGDGHEVVVPAEVSLASDRVVRVGFSRGNAGGGGTRGGARARTAPEGGAPVASRAHHRVEGELARAGGHALGRADRLARDGSHGGERGARCVDAAIDLDAPAGRRWRVVVARSRSGRPGPVAASRVRGDDGTPRATATEDVFRDVLQLGAGERRRHDEKRHVRTLRHDTPTHTRARV